MPNGTLAIVLMNKDGHRTTRVVELLAICTNAGKSMLDRSGKGLAILE